MTRIFTGKHGLIGPPVAGGAAEPHPEHGFPSWADNDGLIAKAVVPIETPSQRRSRMTGEAGPIVPATQLLISSGDTPRPVGRTARLALRKRYTRIFNTGATGIEHGEIALLMARAFGVSEAPLEDDKTIRALTGAISDMRQRPPELRQPNSSWRGGRHRLDGPKDSLAVAKPASSASEE